MKRRCMRLLPCLIALAACGGDGGPEAPDLEEPDVPGLPSTPSRADGARPVAVNADGSLQNPAWSPDGTRIVLTRWRGGYNVGPADLLVVAATGGTPRILVSDGSDNVNLPGSCWSGATDQVVFSSSRDPHDEIYVIAANASPGAEVRITFRSDRVAFEPSFSPDARAVVFESHLLDREDGGVVTRYVLDGTQGYEVLSDTLTDAREPNWSPAGDRIVYQVRAGAQWDLWVADADGGAARRLTDDAGSETDASFSPDGRWVVYSGDVAGTPYANLFVRPATGGGAIRITNHAGYDGAPSWSPDGTLIAFESTPGDPDESAGSTLWVIDVPSTVR